MTGSREPGIRNADAWVYKALLALISVLSGITLYKHNHWTERIERKLDAVIEAHAVSVADIAALKAERGSVFRAMDLILAKVERLDERQRGSP